MGAGRLPAGVGAVAQGVGALWQLAESAAVAEQGGTASRTAHQHLQPAPGKSLLRRCIPGSQD